MPLPTHVQTLIVGGGIAGCATAYHLGQLGQRDVLLLEQGQLTSGTTWHAAGLVGQLRHSRSMTRMSRYGIDLYSRLEAETGLATGWKACGSLSVARTPERWMLLRKQAALAGGFGVEVQLISPQEAGARFPLMRTDDLQGALWIPGDGKANPTDLTMSLAKGARQQGVRLVEGVQVTGVILAEGPTGPRVAGVHTLRNGEPGEVRCDTLINCAGQWARQFGALAGVNVPLYSAEHFYLVTDRIPGVHPMLPVLRDPDGLIYYKEEVGGLVMGGFELRAKPWAVDPIPADFQFQLLNEDWAQFEPLMASALHRTPCLATAPIKMLLNGPESFTPDGNFILGEAPGLRGYFVCAGFNSAGIANAGGAGQLIAQWVVAGEAPQDLWDADIRRFGDFTGNRRALAQRTAETLGLHYAMRWPRQELQSARPLRTSPLYDRLAARGAEFGSKNGWERANYFRPAGAEPAAHTLGRPAWLPWVIEEQRATREAVALYDQSSFGQLLLQGHDALALLQRLCANQIDVAPGRLVYTGMLNARGGYESDLTVLRLAAECFWLITGSAQPLRDADWIGRHITRGMHAVLTNVSGRTSVLSVMGPNARALLARLTPDDLSPAALPFGHSREIDLGLARVRAARMSHVGGPGYELYVPVEMARHVDIALQQAGAGLGLRDAGYWALDALRIEAGRRAWGAELGPDDTPFEAGLAQFVKLDKGCDFNGRAALLDAAGQPLRKKLLRFVLADPADHVWGGEAVWLDTAAAAGVGDRHTETDGGGGGGGGGGGAAANALAAGSPVGELSSAGWGLQAGRCVALGYLRGAAAQLQHAGTPVLIDLWGRRVAATAWDA